MYKSLTSLVKLSLFMAISQMVLNQFAHSLSSDRVEQKISCEKDTDKYWDEKGCQIRKKATSSNFQLTL